MKNLFVLAPLAFSKHLFEAGPAFLGLAAFAVFCGLASSVYLTNDIVDVDKDRQHPKKKLRPIASGALSVGAARVAALVLALGALGGAFALGQSVGVTALAYLILNVAYSFGAKHIVIVDVLCLALGFVLRVLVGGFAINVAVTEWLLVLVFLLALFLGLAKRRHEITSLSERAQDTREVLSQYSPYLIDQMTSVVTASVVTAYAFYTLSPETVAKFGTTRLSWTLPFVVYGIFRYLYLVHQKERGDNPTDVLLTDRPLLCAVALWVVVVVAVIYTAGDARPLIGASR